MDTGAWQATVHGVTKRVGHNIHATLHKAIRLHFFQQAVPSRASGMIRGSVMVKHDTYCSLEP